MCIVSLASFKNGDFILTHNRDENIHRPSSSDLEKREFNRIKITCPIDLISKGTWIFSSEKYVCCVLNGEFKLHKRVLPYRKSRGQIILDVLNYDSIENFLEKVDLIEIEPFTLLMIDVHMNEKQILVWDGAIKHVQNITNQSFVVRSSSTLYSNKAKRFNLKELGSVTPNQKELFKKHDKVKMLKNSKYPNIQTTSITQIVYSNQELNMQFCHTV